MLAALGTVLMSRETEEYAIGPSPEMILAVEQDNPPFESGPAMWTAIRNVVHSGQSPSMSLMTASTRPGVWRGASRLTCVLAITLVFLTGAIAGAVAMNFGAHKYIHPRGPLSGLRVERKSGSSAGRRISTSLPSSRRKWQPSSTISAPTMPNVLSNGKSENPAHPQRRPEA